MPEAGKSHTTLRARRPTVNVGTDTLCRLCQCQVNMRQMLASGRQSHAADLLCLAGRRPHRWYYIGLVVYHKADVADERLVQNGMHYFTVVHRPFRITFELCAGCHLVSITSIFSCDICAARHLRGRVRSRFNMTTAERPVPGMLPSCLMV